MIKLELTEQDKVWATDVDKVVYRNGELKRCYYKVEEYYLLRTFKNASGKERAILAKRPESDSLRHMDLEDLYTDKDSCQAKVDSWNALEEEKWHE